MGRLRAGADGAAGDSSSQPPVIPAIDTAWAPGRVAVVPRENEEIMSASMLNTDIAPLGGRLDLSDVDLAARAVRLHCASRWPTGTRCLNCGWAHPCVTYEWGSTVLRSAGWSERQIAALDARQGAWS